MEILLFGNRLQCNGEGEGPGGGGGGGGGRWQ